MRDKYKVSWDQWEAAETYLTEKYEADSDAYNRMWGEGGYQELLFKAQEASYAAEGQYQSDVYTSAQDYYAEQGEHLKDVYQSQLDA